MYQQNKSSESKVKFSQASNGCKRVLEAAKLAHAHKTKEFIFSQKLGSRGFWQFANSVLNKGKTAIPPLFNSLEVLSFASDKAKSKVFFPVVSKVFEKLVSNMIVDHLKKCSWCCGWLSLLNWIGALTLFLLLKSVRLRLRFETEAALHFYKSTIRPCMEYCCQAWAGAHSCYMQDCLSFTCCFSWTHGWLLKCSQFKSFLYVLLWWCSSELAQLVPLPFFFRETYLLFW